MKLLYLFIIILLISVIIERNTLPATTNEMVAAAHNYGETHHKTTPPKPFHQDGCTLFPDQIFGSDFREACLNHDIAYWYGGPQKEKDLADQKLKAAIAESGFIGDLLQTPFYFGVHYLGDSWLTKFFDANWGFGWNEQTNVTE